MEKERLAVVSSYDDFCGNASYTKALVEELSHHFDVTVISLNVEILRKGDARCAKQHILQIRERLKTFDCVNIQFEASLFGTTLHIIQKRFFMMVKGSKRLLLTVHRYHGKENYPGLVSLGKALLKGDIQAFIAEFRTAHSQNRFLPLYNKIIKFCVKNNFPILIHTPRDRQLIQMKFQYDRVYDHPLCFYDQEQIEALGRVNTKKEFCKAFSLDEKKTYIGIFGFISSIKGHETVIKALKFLPEEYELLILGAQHPHTIRINEPIDHYIKSVLKLIDKRQCSDRVKFFRLTNDEELLKALLGCDFNVLPYLEVNQGGSSIAALSLETHAKSIFSQNFAFLELEKYAPNAFKMFSIGNYLELAQAILTYQPEHYASHLQAYHKKYNIHTSAELYKKLLTLDSCADKVPERSLQPAIPQVAT
ncbi:MAG: hypothetical protein ACHQT8_06885 [Chlamydiales bacterium]